MARDTGSSTTGGRRGWAETLERLDRRVIYGILCVVAVASFILKPIRISSVNPATKAVFDEVERCPDDKVIVLDSSWDMGSQSENRPQFLALVEHMFRRNIKFVVTALGSTPFAPEIAQKYLDELASKYHKQYGVDYVNLGYKTAGGGGVVGVSGGFLLDAFAKDIHAIYPTDFRKTPISKLPLMQRVKSIEQVHLVVVVTYEPGIEWISFIRGQFGTPVVFSCMSIVVPLYAIYYDSNQLAGIIGGTRGAAEYERLLELETAGEGTRLMTPQSLVHLLIIFFIILGNVGYLFGSRRNR
jgi:hypothetical protein